MTSAWIWFAVALATAAVNGVMIARGSALPPLFHYGVGGLSLAFGVGVLIASNMQAAARRKLLDAGLTAAEIETVLKSKDVEGALRKILEQKPKD